MIWMCLPRLVALNGSLAFVASAQGVNLVLQVNGNKTKKSVWPNIYKASCEKDIGLEVTRHIIALQTSLLSWPLPKLGERVQGGTLGQPR